MVGVPIFFLCSSASVIESVLSVRSPMRNSARRAITTGPSAQHKRNAVSAAPAARAEIARINSTPAPSAPSGPNKA